MGDVGIALFQYCLTAGPEEEVDRGKTLGHIAVRPIRDDHIAQRADQHIGLLLVVGTVVFERFTGALVHTEHAPDEHRRQVIADLGELDGNEGHRQRGAFFWLHILHSGGIESLGFGREVLDFDVGDAVQRCRTNVVGRHPCQLVKLLLQMAQGRIAGILFKAIPR